MTTMCQISTAPVKISAASSACSAQRAMSLPIITRVREILSARTPPSRMRPTSGSACAASTSPTSEGVPISVT